MILIIAILTSFFLFRELSEHAKDNKFRGAWEFLNNGEKWRNKHNWKPAWFFKGVGVAFTDPEHAFQLASELCLLAALWLVGGIWAAAAFVIGWCIQGLVKYLTPLQ